MSYTILFIITWIISGLTFDYFSKERTINHCKAAGWKFIEDEIKTKDSAILERLQARLATNCILDLRENKIRYGLIK